MSPVFDFKEWMLEQVVSLTTEKFDKLLMGLWAIWRNRNDTLWSQKPQSTADILCGTMAWYHEFAVANNSSASKIKVGSRPKWKAPAPGTLKLNVDGAFLHNGTRHLRDS